MMHSLVLMGLVSVLWVLFTIGFAGTATFVILRVVMAVTGLRLTEEPETLGMDLSQHGESAYND
jgi:Amt family ammonium transporter